MISVASLQFQFSILIRVLQPTVLDLSCNIQSNEIYIRAVFSKRKRLPFILTILTIGRSFSKSNSHISTSLIVIERITTGNFTHFDFGLEISIPVVQHFSSLFLCIKSYVQNDQDREYSATWTFVRISPINCYGRLFSKQVKFHEVLAQFLCG